MGCAGGVIDAPSDPADSLVRLLVCCKTRRTMKAKCPHCANSKDPVLEPASAAPDAPVIVSCGHCHRVCAVMPNLQPLMAEVQALRQEVAALRQALGR